MTHIVSFSEIDTFRQCPHKHELAYKERWTSSEMSPALRKGRLWHEIMELHYNAINASVDPLSVVMPLLTQNGDDDDDVKDLIQWMYEGYVDVWGAADRTWQVVATEHAAEVWLPTNKGTRSGFKLKVKVDIVAINKIDQRVWLWDHKTGRNLPDQKDLDLDDQFGLYAWCLKQLGIPVFGVLYNAARTQRNKSAMLMEDRYRRVPMTRTDAELECVAIEAWKAAKRAYQIKPGEADRATDSERCGWRCNFTEACLWGRKQGPVAERDFLRDIGFVQDFSRH